MKQSINIIAAMTNEGVIGRKGMLPWYLPDDIRFFRSTTVGNGKNSVIMGKNTYDSIRKPLDRRINIVVSESLYHRDFQSDDKSDNTYLGIIIKPSLEDALNYAGKNSEDIFLIGGKRIFEEGIPIADKMYLTFVKENYTGDIYFPSLDMSGWDVQRILEHKDFDVWLYTRE